MRIFYVIAYHYFKYTRNKLNVFCCEQIHFEFYNFKIYSI